MKITESNSTLPAEIPAFGLAVEELEAGLHGQLIRPGDVAYEQARRLWNGQVNKYPALIWRKGNACLRRCAGLDHPWSILFSPELTSTSWPSSTRLRRMGATITNRLTRSNGSATRRWRC